MQTPAWALALSFWLHMVATVTWVGGLATLSLVALPAAQRSLDAETYARFLRGVNRRLDALGWIGLSVLTATGLVQMGANPNYEGFLAFGNNWSQAILLKHVVFLGIVGISAYQTWTLAPALERVALMRARGKEADELEALQAREARLMRLNLALGAAALVFTALARVA